MEPLSILFRDEHYVAVDKPAGVVVHRTRGAGIGTPLLQRLRDRIGQHVYPVHRLDRPTSGVIVYGLSPEAARRLAGAFAARRVDKRYLAIVRGYTAETATIDYALDEEGRSGRRDAVTTFRRLATAELPIPVSRYPSARYSLVEARPITGRRHQIRRHFKHIFHPILGDTNHGDRHHNHMLRDRLDLWRLYLMAARLAFSHPFSGEAVCISAPPCARFRAFFDLCGWRQPLFTPRSEAEAPLPPAA